MSQFIDITNKKFGRLLVLSRANERNADGILWHCLCDCGTKKLISGKGLRSGSSTSCGCYFKEVQKGFGNKVAVDLTGKKFTLLKAIECIGVGKDNSRIWLCDCDCGNKKEVSAAALVKKHVKSCGCLVVKYSKERNRVWNIWNLIRNRCNNKKLKMYKHYGEKGIKICDRWLDFNNFYQDMGNPPSLKHSIDRIDYKGNYEPSNCRWATLKEQMNNMSTNRKITYNGETKNLQEWANLINVNHKTLSDRIDKHGWSIEKAFTTKARMGYNRKTNRLLTHKGKTQTLKEWAKELGINFQTIAMRIDKSGWSVERALTTKPKG